MGTQTDAYEEARPSRASSRLRAIPSSSIATPSQPIEDPILTKLKEDAFNGRTDIVIQQMNSLSKSPGSTLLESAFDGGHTDTIEAIWPYLSPEEIKDACAHAIKKSPLHCVPLALKKYVRGWGDFNLFLKDAVSSQDPRRVQMVLDATNKKYINNRILKFAIEQSDNDDISILKLLIDHGATVNPNPTFIDKRCPLFFPVSPITVATKKGNLTILRFLLDKGANPLHCYNGGNSFRNYGIDILTVSAIPAVNKMLREAIEQRQLHQHSCTIQ